jgi:hypothetical protein
MSQIFNVVRCNGSRRRCQRSWTQDELAIRMARLGVDQDACGSGYPHHAGLVESNGAAGPLGHLAVELASGSSTTQRRVSVLGPQFSLVNSPAAAESPMKSGLHRHGIDPALMVGGGKS